MPAKAGTHEAWVPAFAGMTRYWARGLRNINDSAY
jgi:hypothetical protein